MSISLRRTAIDGALLIEPLSRGDNRGYFKETYVRSKYAALGVTDTFVQDSVSVSWRDVLRGLHGDVRMSKLVQVFEGEVYDVVVDARIGSPTLGRWEAFRLSSDNHLQLYIPAGCLHGFQALSDRVIFSYKQSAEYDPAREISALWNDPELGIDWPEPDRAIVSEKDRQNGSFARLTAAATP